MKRIDSFLAKIITLPMYVEILLGLVFLLRVPTFFEPFYNSSEMLSLSLGNAIRNGLVVYKDIYASAPPLLYIVAAIAGNVFWFKVFLAFASLLAITYFYKLASAIFDKEKKAMVATIAFTILTTLPLLEGNVANSEIFMVLFTILGFLFFLVNKHTFRNIFISGIFFSIAVLFKTSAAFEVLALVVYLLLTNPANELTKTSRKLLYLLLGFLTPILLTAVWFYSNGAINEYLNAVFWQDINQIFQTNNLALIARGGVLILGTLLLWIKRTKLSKEFIFASIWLLFSLFALTLSEKAYPHNFLEVVTSLSLLITILIKSESLDQVLTIIPLTLALIIPVYYKFHYFETFSYYSRFINFATGKISKESYLSSFDKNILSNYEISDFVVKSTTPNDRIFVWGDSPVIYALTRRTPSFRYFGSDQISTFSSKREVLENLNLTKPSFIIMLHGSPKFSEIMPFLNNNYMLISGGDGSQIWHKIPTNSK